MAEESHLAAPSAPSVDVKVEGDMMTLEDVLTISIPQSRLLQVEGIVTYKDHRRTIIQNKNKGLLVWTVSPCLYEVGDFVSVKGVASPEALTISLKAYSFDFIEKRALPSAQKIESFEKENWKEWNHVYTTITAEVLEKRVTAYGSILTCVADGKVFQAGSTEEWLELQSIPLKAKIQLTGIFQLVASDVPLSPHHPDGFQFLISNFADVEVIETRDWWNARRLMNIFLLLGLVLIISWAWVLLLRRKLASQTAIIRSKITQESATKERERVARELHDSLEQNLSAVVFQIDNTIRNYERDQQGRLGASLQITKKMLKACQRESREAIYDLRNADEESAAWRDEMLLSEAERHGSEIKLKIIGQPFSLDADIRRQVRRIVREATYNAIRHGQVSRITVQYHYDPEFFKATVNDNGSGFDINGPRPEGHFGLAGMEERAGRIGAKFELESSPGVGTTVSIKLNFKKKK